MRDYLKLEEVKAILSDYVDDPKLLHEAFKDVANAANACLCYAFSYEECTCGSWELGEGEYEEEEDSD